MRIIVQLSIIQSIFRFGVNLRWECLEIWGKLFILWPWTRNKSNLNAWQKLNLNSWTPSESNEQNEPTKWMYCITNGRCEKDEILTLSYSLYSVYNQNMLIYIVSWLVIGSLFDVQRCRQCFLVCSALCSVHVCHWLLVAAIKREEKRVFIGRYEINVIYIIRLTSLK